MIIARRKCRASQLARGARFLATGGGDGKKNAPIDFNALFKSVANKPPEKKVEPIDFKKLFSQTTPSSSSTQSSTTSPGEKFKLDLSRNRNVDGEKLKIDLSKLFGDSSKSTANNKPGQGGLKGFKLDLSKLTGGGGGNQGGTTTGGTLRPLPSSNEDARIETLQKLVNKFNVAMGPAVTLPPKDHLVEKYYSEENMSLAEKRKKELTQIRNEFRMHESDCGSSPVQIAMLTRKIKHMAQHFTVHKKDIHSRRGLNGMIQLRRKHLIYLRRKDWDVYCHVLARLSLKDNLDVPNSAKKPSKKKKRKGKSRARKRSVRASQSTSNAR